MSAKPRPEIAKPDAAKQGPSKPDTATLMAMFADEASAAPATPRTLPSRSDLTAVASDAWREAQPMQLSAAVEGPRTGDRRQDVARRPSEPPSTTAAPRPDWMRIKADEQRFTSVRFSPELTEVLRHLAFLTRQSKTSLLNEALIDLVAKYRKSGVPLPELTADGALKS